jgi:hypothetical protein
MSRIFLARAELRLGHVEAAHAAAEAAHATAASWSLPADIAAMLARMDAEIGDEPALAVAERPAGGVAR